MLPDNVNPQEPSSSPPAADQKRYSLRNNALIKTLASLDALTLAQAVLALVSVMVLGFSILIFVFYIYGPTKSNEAPIAIERPTINKALLQQVHKELDRRQQILQAPPRTTYPNPFR